MMSFTNQRSNVFSLSKNLLPPTLKNLLARRADRKQRVLNETQAKLNKDQVRMPSPIKTHKKDAQSFDDLEVKSDCRK